MEHRTNLPAFKFPCTELLTAGENGPIRGKTVTYDQPATSALFANCKSQIANLKPASLPPVSHAHPSAGNHAPGSGRSTSCARNPADAAASRAGHAHAPDL